MAQNRAKGFIVGSDTAHGKTTWKVRVKNGPSELKDRKLVVASFRDGCHTLPGLEVTFEIGQFNEGQTVLKAVDVAMAQIELSAQPRTTTCKCDHCGEPAEICMELSWTHSDSAFYFRACVPHIYQSIIQIQTTPVAGERVVRCMNNAAGDNAWKRMVV